jgi:hypothetical protein
VDSLPGPFFALPLSLAISVPSSVLENCTSNKLIVILLLVAKMSEPDPSKFSFRRWARGVKEDVKDGFKQIVRSTPPTPSPSPGSHSRSADHGVEGSTTSTPAAEHAINDTLRVPIASPYPTRPQSTPPTLLAAPSQLQRLPSATPIVSSSEGQTNHSIIESSQTVAPDLAQYESAPITQEAARTDHPQAPFALHEAIPAHIPIVDTQQALQTSTSANLQPSSNLGPLANPSGGSTNVQKGEEKPSSPWYAGIRTTLALVERAADAFPPLKSTVAGINGILDLCDVSLSLYPACGHAFTLFHRPLPITNETSNVSPRG